MENTVWFKRLGATFLLVISVSVWAEDWGRLVIQCGDAGKLRGTQFCTYLNELTGCAKNGTTMLDGYQCTKKLADLGNPLAANQLGLWYLQGRVAPQNLSEARKYLYFAAVNRLPSAMRRMMQLENMQGNLVRAYAWALIGAAFEDKTSIFYRDEIRAVLTDSKRQKAETIASKIFELIAR
ncbi:Sel1 domain protein repeat-containing protein [Nitrosococcus halophilus Nc 4]|uniref:Sel1 domain protein repeat-containing protein n=1 Tax=Nitrosococcus halophilus (strain Nc4) TaxID=472759 RepID=D5BUP3_NITHN|nr:sel1 repeat family protein [Nitrosococcus halophilus]ADE13443.1 Sel1 domain protein repeat-containing protein [Nitrosococcus halophilus Nc 4]